MGVEEFTSLEDFKAKIAGDTPVLIDFTAKWCGPCRIISPIFEGLSKKSEFEKVKFYKVDVDSQSSISEEVGVRAMPTFMLFKEGKKLGELVGALPPGLEELVKKAQSFAGNTELSSSTGAAPPSNENPDAQSVVGGLELPSSTSDSTGDASSAGVPADTKA